MPSAPLLRDRDASRLKRREFLRAGMVGYGGLTLPGLMRLRAEAAATPDEGPTALIVVWLPGGASHLETYDPKPTAAAEFRGPFSPISTAVPGTQICELLPRQAALADKFTLLRSLVHTGFCHQQGTQQLFTGHPVRDLKQKPDHPDCLAITNYLRRQPGRSLPAYVGVNQASYLGAAYLGPAYEPFAVSGNPNLPEFSVPNIGLKDNGARARLDRRLDLRGRLDRLRRDIDLRGDMQALDTFEQDAWHLLTSPAAQQAFDLNQEDPKVRDRYGRSSWGQQCLLARRLVEAGVELITTTLGGAEAGRVGNWDDHAVNHHVFDVMRYRAPVFDQAVSALIEDLYERGLSRRVMVVVSGEFGRTPRISYQPSSDNGVVQPGRDHWPSATSMLFAGGGLAAGQVIGATDGRGEHVTERIVGVKDFLATIYRHLGVDPEGVEFADFFGRPIPILNEGAPIPELVRQG